MTEAEHNTNYTTKGTEIMVWDVIRIGVGASSRMKGGGCGLKTHGKRGRQRSEWRGFSIAAKRNSETKQGEVISNMSKATRDRDRIRGPGKGKNLQIRGTLGRSS